MIIIHLETTHMNTCGKQLIDVNKHLAPPTLARASEMLYLSILPSGSGYLVGLINLEINYRWIDLFIIVKRRAVCACMCRRLIGYSRLICYYFIKESLTSLISSVWCYIEDYCNGQCWLSEKDVISSSWSRFEMWYTWRLYFLGFLPVPLLSHWLTLIAEDGDFPLEDGKEPFLCL